MADIFGASVTPLIYTTPSLGVHSLSTPSLVMEEWVTLSSVSGRRNLFSVVEVAVGTDVKQRVLWQVIVTSGQLAISVGGGTTSSLPAGTITTARTHVAWEANAGGTHSLYINGALVLTYVSPYTASIDSATAGVNLYVAMTTDDVSALPGNGSPTYPAPAVRAGTFEHLRTTKVARYGGRASFTPLDGGYDATVPPTAPGDGAVAGTVAPAVLGTPQIKRQGDGAAAGTTGGSVVGARVRQTVAGAAGTSTAVMESGEEADPPSFSSALTLSALLGADLTSDAALTAAASASTTMAGAQLRDGALDAVLTISPTWATQMELSGELSAVLSVLANLPQQVDRGTAWVLNVETGATSRYEGYEFNSFGKIGTTYFGCKTDGIYTLGGDDDAGTPIRASVSFGRHDLGSPQLKRMVKAYIDAASTATLFLKITTPQGEFVYEARDSDELLMTQRFDVGRGLEGRHFLLELFNNDGCDFTLAGAEFLASEIMNRRI